MSAFNSRLNPDNSVNNDNLFVGNHTIDDILHVLIEHAQAIAFWIASEIINCKTPKVCMCATSGSRWVSQWVSRLGRSVGSYVGEW